VKEMEGFARKIKDVRDADFRLANRCRSRSEANIQFAGLTRLVVRRASIDGAAILEKPVSDLGTLEDLSQSAESATFGDRKSLILNGEMRTRDQSHNPLKRSLSVRP
jgi:hypothetical protein